jgi:hypothetical protein
VPCAKWGSSTLPLIRPRHAAGATERAFQTHQGRLPQELARADIKDMGSANQYLEKVYRHGHNQEFGVASTLPGTAYVPFISGSLPDVLCEHHERTVGNDNCVAFEGLTLQIPADEFRYHYVRTRVRVHRYVDAPRWRCFMGHASWQDTTPRACQHPTRRRGTGWPRKGRQEPRDSCQAASGSALCNLAAIAISLQTAVERA